jgi:predicted phosphodiesterase
MRMRKKKIKRIVVISDLQVPFHDTKAIRNVSKFITKYKPDDVLCVGDELDFQTISRWSSGRDEWSGTIGRDRNTCQEVLYDLRVTHIVRSNHTDRLYKSLASRLPGLIGLPELEYENFMGFRELGIKFHRKPYEITKDWIMVHGDEQSTKPHGGLTALEAAKRHGKSVVCGHTHRQGISSFTTASGGHLTGILTGFEVGHLMDTTQAYYTRGTFNWQQGFGILYVDRKGVTPVTVPIDKSGSFVVEGKRYG